MWTYCGEAPVSVMEDSTTIDNPLASVTSRVREGVVSQIAPLLSAPTQVLRTLAQAVSFRPQLGHQEDSAVAEEFDRIYQCTVQYTGDDHTAPQFVQAADVDPTSQTRSNPDLIRELAEAQKDDPRIYHQRRRPALEAAGEDFGELPESGWQEVQKPEDIYAFHDGPGVYSLDSKHDDTILDSQWSVLGHTERKNDCECVPELRTMPPEIAPTIIHGIPTDMTRVV
ncbi:hypothetical protein BGX38DRAFT_1182018 [Terfezia claveryi]|nr:hypothetical protein BGX38DRAFT_1182018 [Terfezia claveryi]